MDLSSDKYTKLQYTKNYKDNLVYKRIENINYIFNNDNNKILLQMLNDVDISKINNIVYNDIRGILAKKNLDFYNVIQILDGKLLYMKSGSSGHTFKSIQSNENKLSYSVKTVAYPKKTNYGDMFNSTRPENVEILILNILASFVINKQTPHIILPITTFNTEIKIFINLYKNNIVKNDKYKNFVNKFNNGDYYNNVSILISEWANGGDLLDYMRKNYKHIKLIEWKTLFFQILSVLAIIQTKYPAFKHNDMKANNILINNTYIENSNKKYQYNINGNTYVIPHIGYQIKLWDFDFACIDNLVVNSKVESDWAKSINITSKQNRYYDIHYFFNTLIKKGFLPELLKDPAIPKEIVEFINRIVPKEYRQGEYVTDSGRFLKDIELYTADNIIRNDILFKAFR